MSQELNSMYIYSQNTEHRFYQWCTTVTDALVSSGLLLSLFVWNTLTVSLTMLITILLRQDPLRVDVACLQKSQFFNYMLCACIYSKLPEIQRSCSSQQLSVHITKLYVGKRTFTVGAPIIWNALSTRVNSSVAFRKSISLPALAIRKQMT